MSELSEELRYYKQCEESIMHIREYLDVMRDEPEGYIKLSRVYHDLRRMLGDE